MKVSPGCIFLRVLCAVWVWAVPGLLLAQEGNLCLGRPVKTSAATLPGYPASNLTDGDRLTFSHPQAAFGTLGFYFEIDLGSERALERLVLTNRSGCCPQRLSRYQVTLLADDGGKPGAIRWSAAMRLDGSYPGNGALETLTMASGEGEAFAGRFLRIENVGGDAYSPQIAEVEAWPAPVPVIRIFETDAGNITKTGSPGRPISANLRWQVDNFTSLSISPGVGPLAGASGTLEVSPQELTTYVLTAVNSSGSAVAAVTVGVDLPESPPVLTEFMAEPNGGLEDEDGDSPDWVEIYNPNIFSFNMAAYHLSDARLNPQKWTFPSVSIPAQGFLVVFASGKDRRENGASLHTNFSLRSAGEVLLMSAPGGNVLAGQFPGVASGAAVYPPQSRGRSYGLDSGGKEVYFGQPTPGMPNGEGFSGVVEDLVFSLPRGFYDEPQTLLITTPTPGAVIRYTTNRTAPSATNGTIYEGPLTIAGTTVVRAAAFRDDWAPPPVVTHSYIFPEQVKSSAVMRTSITGSSVYGPQVVPALRDLPSFSLVAPANIPNGTDVPASLEYLLPEGEAGEGFHENCGVERFGGAYTEFAKKSFRIHFRGVYGKGRLKYPLFSGRGRGSVPVESFNSLELRNGSHDMVERGFYLSNPFTDALMLDMGQLNPHGRWVHLYLNGSYWGVYHLRERWDDAMHQSYLGGKREQYEAINGNLNVGGWAEPGDPYAGDGSAWARIKSLRGNYSKVREFLDVPNFIDYMLTFMFGDSEDEYRVVGPAEAGSGFKWFLNDADGWLRTSAGNNTVRSAPGRLRGDGPGSVFSMLFREGDPDYRMLLADRIQRHFFNGGALTPARNIARLNELSADFERPFIAESARWNYRTPSSWQGARNTIVSSWFPNRTAAVLNQFRSTGFFPTVAAPLFSQRGGVVMEGAQVTLSAVSGTVYYTVDGSDPRLPGGAVSPAALEIPVEMAAAMPVEIRTNTLVRARTWAQEKWSALDEAFFQTGPEAVAPGDVVVSELYFHPPGGVAQEFVELENVSRRAVNLRGCWFSDGIGFAFPDNRDTFLAPGQRLVLVEDMVEFRRQHGVEIPVAGRYSGKLSNDGEKIALRTGAGVPLFDFTFNDNGAWPSGADGEGYSMVRRGNDGDPASGAAWRNSAGAGGSPGTTDEVLFTGLADADEDADGWPALAEHAFGTSDLDALSGPGSVTPQPGGIGFVKVNLRRNLRAGDVICGFEISLDLKTWGLPPASATLDSQQPARDGTASETWLVPVPVAAGSVFVRVRVTRF